MSIVLWSVAGQALSVIAVGTLLVVIESRRTGETLREVLASVFERWTH